MLAWFITYGPILMRMFEMFYCQDLNMGPTQFKMTALSKILRIF